MRKWYADKRRKFQICIAIDTANAYHYQHFQSALVLLQCGICSSECHYIIIIIIVIFVSRFVICSCSKRRSACMNACWPSARRRDHVITDAIAPSKAEMTSSATSGLWLVPPTAVWRLHADMSDRPETEIGADLPELRWTAFNPLEDI